MLQKKIKISMLALCLCILLSGFAQISTYAKILKLQVLLYKDGRQIVYKDDCIPYQEDIIFSLPNSKDMSYEVREENGEFYTLSNGEYGVSWGQIPPKNGKYTLIFCGKNEFTGEEKYHSYVLRTW